MIETGPLETQICKPAVRTGGLETHGNREELKQFVEQQEK